MTRTLSPGVFRSRLLDARLPALRSDVRVRGGREGGSVATGPADEYSDHVDQLACRFMAEVEPRRKVAAPARAP